MLHLPGSLPELTDKMFVHSQKHYVSKKRAARQLYFALYILELIKKSFVEDCDERLYILCNNRHYILVQCLFLLGIQFIFHSALHPTSKNVELISSSLPIWIDPFKMIHQICGIFSFLKQFRNEQLHWNYLLIFLIATTYQMFFSSFLKEEHRRFPFLFLKYNNVFKEQQYMHICTYIRRNKIRSEHIHLTAIAVKFFKILPQEKLVFLPFLPSPPIEYFFTAKK